jgi:hypothetical protein
LKHLQAFLAVNFIEIHQQSPLQGAGFRSTILRSDNIVGVLLIPNRESVRAENAWATVVSAIIVHQRQNSDEQNLSGTADGVEPITCADSGAKKSLRHKSENKKAARRLTTQEVVTLECENRAAATKVIIERHVPTISQSQDSVNTHFLPITGQKTAGWTMVCLTLFCTTGTARNVV